MKHYVERCSCGIVIRQCRCPSRDKEVRVVQNGCSRCMVAAAMAGPGPLSAPSAPAPAPVLKTVAWLVGAIDKRNHRLVQVGLYSEPRPTMHSNYFPVVFDEIIAKDFEEGYKKAVKRYRRPEWEWIQGMFLAQLRHDVKSKDEEPCDHARHYPRFDAEQARGMSAAWVREVFPRFFDVCKDCGEKVILYASTEHFVAGDW